MGKIKVIDTHCDVLYKMQLARRKERKVLSFHKAPQLEANGLRLQKGKIFVQFFALFIPPFVSSEDVWIWTKEQIMLFQQKIIEKNNYLIQIRDWKEIFTLETGQIGAVLSLEGAESFGNDLEKLHELRSLGVLSIGLTWNKANLCADGCGEPRGAGLTTLGKEVVTYMNQHNLLSDVSHLSERAFWDVLEQADNVFASHSNVYSLCAHSRNLTDEQIKAIIKKNGQIHLTFYPPFIQSSSEKKTTFADLIQHIDYICSLGGAKHIGFGSDFDGIDQHMIGLENSSMYPSLIETLLTYFSESEVEGFAYKNFLNFISSLPS